MKYDWIFWEFTLQLSCCRILGTPGVFEGIESISIIKKMIQTLPILDFFWKKKIVGFWQENRCLDEIVGYLDKSFFIYLAFIFCIIL